ncbi:hypothetical protein BDW71DRAFT_172307 [Aspergillus fruticulosus]
MYQLRWLLLWQELASGCCSRWFCNLSPGISNSSTVAIAHQKIAVMCRSPSWSSKHLTLRDVTTRSPTPNTTGPTPLSDIHLNMGTVRALGLHNLLPHMRAMHVNVVMRRLRVETTHPLYLDLCHALLDIPALTVLNDCSSQTERASG